MTASEAIQILQSVPPDTPVVAVVDSVHGREFLPARLKGEKLFRTRGGYGQFLGACNQWRNDTLAVVVT